MLFRYAIDCRCRAYAAPLTLSLSMLLSPYAASSLMLYFSLLRSAIISILLVIDAAVRHLLII